ncbi:ATP-binding cassette domain-containing protein [archaeon]|nr:ATP-binding cassette domain-containing protein [archaeon]
MENVTLRVRDRLLLPNTDWQIDRGQQWAVLGPNGSGKTSLVKALTGEVPIVRGKLSFFPSSNGTSRTGYVSFEQHQRLIAREEKRDESRYFSGKLDQITTVYETLLESCPEPGNSAIIVEQTAADLKILDLLERNIRALSTGEVRKVQIARVLINTPEILILDEPFDGLDQSFRKGLTQIINNLMDDSRTVILVTHRQREILPNISHVLVLRDGGVIFKGKREEVLIPGRLKRLYPASFATPFSIPARTDDFRQTTAGAPSEVLISMKEVFVKYENTTVLKNVHWTVKTGENWVILGPNGCGKTTLLNLITGDNLQAYANEIYLFGKRRGTGESIWDIKSRIGMISSELQIRYRKPLTAFEVVLSGFFDSVGLYRHSTQQQQESAEQWMEVLGIAAKSNRIFNQLSYGEQRMLLLARSMVKFPRILILDEPCQGLDRPNRRRILDAIDVIGRRGQTNILYVTHYPDEMPACMTHMLQFEKGSSGKYRTESRRLQPIATVDPALDHGEI